CHVRREAVRSRPSCGPPVGLINGALRRGPVRCGHSISESRGVPGIDTAPIFTSPRTFAASTLGASEARLHRRRVAVVALQEFSGKCSERRDSNPRQPARKADYRGLCLITLVAASTL